MQPMKHPFSLKKTLTVLFLLSNFISIAQRTLFGSQNNYVAPTAVAPTVNGSLITEGLVLNLDAGDLSSYSGTGTTWTDLSGNGNHGTLVNSVTYTSSNQGALVFNGNGNGTGPPNPYVGLPTNTDFDFGTGDFTIEMWTYITTVNPHPNLLTINGNSSWYAAIRFGYWQGNFSVSHSYNGSSWVPNIISYCPADVNTWLHIVVSRISGMVKIYVNNVEKTSYALPGSLMANAENQIGQLNHPSIGYFNLSGKIAITKIYKGKGLTSAEVNSQFNLVKSRYGL
jgi:hypothetical protein